MTLDHKAGRKGVTERVRDAHTMFPQKTAVEIAKMLGIKNAQVHSVARSNRLPIPMNRVTSADPTNTGCLCPVCDSRNTGVKDSRPGNFAGVATIIRRRACGDCGARWPTHEVLEAKLSEMVDNAYRADNLRAEIKNFIEAKPEEAAE